MLHFVVTDLNLHYLRRPICSRLTEKKNFIFYKIYIVDNLFVSFASKCILYLVGSGPTRYVFAKKKNTAGQCCKLQG